MKILLNPKGILVILASLTVLGAGIAYAVNQISRDLPGSFAVGAVQTSEDTIVLYRQLNPSAADLLELDFGTGDIDAFGFFAAVPRVHFWAANAGGRPFDLTLHAMNVQVNGGPSPIFLNILMGPAGGELLHPPDNTVRLDPGAPPMALEAGLDLMDDPAQFGLLPGDQIGFTAFFIAALEQPPTPTPTPTPTPNPTPTPTPSPTPQPPPAGPLMDVNGDGFDDFIVGAPDASPGGLAQAGSAYIYSGANGSLIYRIDGPAAGDGFGASVSMAGDVDSDGFGDFIVGAPIVCLCLLRDDPGSAYVFSGADASLIYRVDGTAADDRFGTSVSIAGDVDGDGVPDFVVGAPASRVSFFFGAGSAYVFSGANGGLIYRKNGPALGFGLGRSVSGAGDVDSDGFDDFIAGASGADPDGLTDAGSAFVYSGADGSVIHRIDGATSGDLLGLSVSGAGDVDGDGLSDFIIGATFADPGGRSDAGSAYVHSGADGLLIHQVDGDGFADFVVGAPGWGFIAAADPGSASVFSGADGSLIHQVIGEAGDDELGSSASRAGDVDGDGFPDFVVGARKADPGGRADAGSAYVISGSNGSVIHQVDGEAAGDGLGALRLPVPGDGS